jgi:hypothetical protein
LGDFEPFGVIGVGDPSTLWKLCEAQEELITTDREFCGSLFDDINEPHSMINIMIGSKQFSEGWNTRRVNTIGLMNIGKPESSGIMRLFEPSVRFTGHDLSVKGSSPDSDKGAWLISSF